MDEEKTKEEVKGLSRREFLKDAGLVVGGTAIGSMAILSACKGETTTVTSTKTVTTTAPGGTSTATVTSPPVTTTVTAAAAGKFTDPTDGTEWPSLDALKAHFNTVHPNADSNIVGLNVNGVDYNVRPWAFSA
jgi:hypothetical protein